MASFTSPLVRYRAEETFVPFPPAVPPRRARCRPGARFPAVPPSGPTLIRPPSTAPAATHCNVPRTRPESARTGGQAIDRATAIDGGPKRLDQPQARVAVPADLSVDGTTDHTVSFPVVNGETLIRVDVKITYQRSLLGLVGFDRTVTVSGHATARP